MKQPFAQLFSLHAFVKRGNSTKKRPLLFVLMSGRKTHDYKDVLRGVIGLLPSEPRVKRVVIDFERAMWKGFVSVMPEVELKGCAFHWSQAVWRKVQEYSRQQQYMKHTGTLTYIKRLVALPFLPAQHIPAAFNNLAQDAGNEPLCRLVEYVRYTWLDTTKYVLLHAGTAASRGSQIDHHPRSSDQRKEAPETSEEDVHPPPSQDIPTVAGV